MPEMDVNLKNGLTLWGGCDRDESTSSRSCILASTCRRMRSSIVGHYQHGRVGSTCVGTIASLSNGAFGAICTDADYHGICPDCEGGAEKGVEKGEDPHFGRETGKLFEDISWLCPNCG
jgi:hypothetical protein